MKGTQTLQKLRGWLANLGTQASEYLIAPLPAALVAALVLIPIGAWVVAFWDGPQVYKIIVLSPPQETTDPSDEGTPPKNDDYSEKFWEGFLAGANAKQDGTLPFTFRGVTLQVQREFEAPTPESLTSNAQSLSSVIARRSDTLMVVLNLSSTTTKEILPEYLQQSTPVPVILTATNPNLLPPKLSEDNYPVLRMLPSDDAQVKAAADFAKEQAEAEPSTRKGAEPVFWVAEDTFSENQTYSHFLATQFVEEAERCSLGVHLWSSSYNVFPVDALSDLGVNWVLFTGDWSHALILIRQLNAISKRAKRMHEPYQPPSLILNETSMDQRLIDQGGPEVDRIYLTYSMPKWNKSDKGMGSLGSDTFQVAKQLLASADSKDFAEPRGGSFYKLKRFLGIRRVIDARNALITKMERCDTTYDLGAKKCEFDRLGTKWVDENNQKYAPKFHVFQVRNGHFQHVDQDAIAERSSDRAVSMNASAKPSPGPRLIERAALSRRRIY